MGVRFIRQPSETPNISNGDDARLFRYALGNQNGYIKNYGLELDHGINGATFEIKKGIAVIQGYEIEVDASGWSLTVEGISTTLYYVIYAEINLVTQTGEIKSQYNTGSYPSVSGGDDLTSNQSGIARMALYRFTASSSIISSVVKLVGPARYANQGIFLAEPQTEAGVIVASLVGSGWTAVQTSGTLAPGWYEVILAGGGGGGGRGASAGKGGQGGYIETRFFVPHGAGYKLMAGGGGYAGYSTGEGGGGGGGSVLDIPQIGILIISSGGGGGYGGEHPGGGGGGYGSGGGNGWAPVFDVDNGRGGGGGGI